MRLVDDDQRIARQIVDERRRRLARIFAGQVTRVVFDATTKTHLLDHLEIKHGALVKPLRFNQFSFRDQLRFPPLELLADCFDRSFDRRPRHHVVSLRIDRHARRVLLDHFAKQRIDRGDRVDLIAPQLDAIRLVLVTRIDLDDVTANTKSAALKVDV